MDGFATFTKTINLEEGDVYPVFATLKSNSPLTKDYYSKHLGDLSATMLHVEVNGGTGEVRSLFPLKGNGFEVKQIMGPKGFSHFQVTCHVNVISRLDCKFEARAAVFADPILLNPNFFVFVYKDM